jgi:ubiquinone/menaquinone biosynthesis C-methylase UbiE
MLARTLEPEVMDTAEEAADYDAMDHSTVNRVFVDDFVAALNRGLTPPGSPMSVLDVGTGTALIPIELVRQVRELGDLRSGQRHGQETGRNLRVTAIDLAEEMLKLGRINVERAEYSDCITLELVDAKGLPYANSSFDAVMSNSIVHHIPEPRGTLAAMWRVLRPGGLLFVRDLLRPETNDEVERIVATYAGNESPRQQQLFRQSLHAALTVDEVGALLGELGVRDGRPAVGSVARSGNRPQLASGDRPQPVNAPHPGPPPGKRGEGEECVRQTSDRHWTVVAWR